MQLLASLYESLGKYKKYLKISETVLDLRKEVLGEKHPDTLSSLNNIAWGYYLCGNYREGIPYAQKSVEFKKENDNVSWKSKVISNDTLALLYSESGEIQKAIDIAVNDLDIVREFFDLRLIIRIVVPV